MNTRIYLNDKFIEFIQGEAQSSQDQSFKFNADAVSEKKLNKLVENFIDETKKIRFIFPILISKGTCLDKKIILLYRSRRWFYRKGK